jgi:Membrane bound beta barrel domain (DUF5777)
MSAQAIKQFVRFRSKIFTVAVSLIFLSSLNIFSQTTVAPKVPDNVKVTFDETTSGIMIIESNGEKYRVDSVKKTVEKLTSAETETPKTETVAETKPQPEPATQTDEQEESQYNFDKGEEPYDYRLINLPTPKSVPKGTWNMSFNHRFSQPINPIKESGKNLLGFDSYSISSFGVSYGITDKLYVNAYRSPLCQRGLCKTIELGIGYHWLDQTKKSPIALTTYASVEGNDNFTEEYTYNLQTMMSSRVGKRVYLFFSPALSLNSNGQHRFNPRGEDYFPYADAANKFHLPSYTASFGFGAAVMITPKHVALFEFTPRIGFKLGRVEPIFDNDFNVTGFNNISKPSIGFGYQWNIGKHSFTLTLSNTQTTTTSRYNSSNLILSPKNVVIGFNLFRRW